MLRLSKHSLLSQIALVVALTSCSVGPDYKQPETPLVKRAFPTEQGVFSAQEVDLSWWRSFKDEQLVKLVILATTENKDVHQALARFNEARALYGEAEFRLFPIVTSGLGYQSNRVSIAQYQNLPPNINPRRDTENYSVGFDAVWELDFFGRVRRQIEQQGAEEEAALASLQDVLRSIVAEVARNYFTLRGSQELLAVAERNVELQKESYRLTEVLVRGGERTELDTARALELLESTKAEIPAIQAAIQSSINRLAVLVGKQSAEIEQELVAKAPLPTYQGAVALGEPHQLLRRRPDVRAAERRLAAATAGVGVAVGELFPKVTFTGSFGYQVKAPDTIDDGRAEFFNIGPRISWAAFDSWRVRQLVRAADARAQGALAAYEQSVLVALEDTSTALSNYAREQERVVHLDAAAVASEKASSLAQIQYQYGLVDFLIVLDAQRAALIDQLALTRSKTQLSTQLVAIFKALGGGWEEVQIESLEQQS